MEHKKITDDQVLREAARDHFLLNGDVVQAKGKSDNDAHSSYNVLRGPLTRYAYSKLDRNWQDAEDAVQSAYVSVLETAKINAFFNFGGLYKIWLDRAIRDIRMKDVKEGEVIQEDEEVPNNGGLTIIDLAEGDSPDTQLLMDVQDRVDVLIESSNSFPRTAKAIIRLTVLYGYSYKEVAAMTNVSIKRVENTLVYFRRKYYGIQAK